MSWRSRDATFAAILANPAARIADAPALLQAMAGDGVDHAVVMGMGWADYRVAVEANDYLIEAVSAHTNRLTGFASVNPAWGAAAVEEAERCAAAGLRGIGELHPDTQGFNVSRCRNDGPSDGLCSFPQSAPASPLL